MHLRNKKTGLWTYQETKPIHNISYCVFILHQRNDIDSVSSYNNDRAHYPTFQIYYKMLLSLKNVIFISNELCS